MLRTPRLISEFISNRTPAQPSNGALIPAPASDRDLEELLLTACHELLSPMAAVRYSALLLQKPAAGADVHERAHRCIERQLAQMARVLQDAVAIVRTGSTWAPLKREQVDLRDVVRRSVDTLQGKLRERDQRLTLSLPDSAVWLHADPGKLEQVFVNLLGNAVKFTDHGGSLRIGVKSRLHQAEICVADSGKGIAPEVLPHVFDLFTQAQPGAGHLEEGLGIGLALVRRIVELHGGCVSAASAGPGQGSQFIVHLPCCERDAAAVRRQPDAEQLGTWEDEGGRCVRPRTDAANRLQA